jgi:hypothetical protein
VDLYGPNLLNSFKFKFECEALAAPKADDVGPGGPASAARTRRAWLLSSSLAGPNFTPLGVISFSQPSDSEFILRFLNEFLCLLKVGSQRIKEPLPVLAPRKFDAWSRS